MMTEFSFLAELSLNPVGIWLTFKRLNVVEIMSVYEKTWIRRQNNVGQQIAGVVLLTHSL